MAKRSLQVTPGTGLGWWSVWLLLAMPVLFVIGGSLTGTLYADVPSGNTILEDISARPALALAMLAGMLAGIAAFVTGLLAILRKKDGALLVYAATVVGALLLIFLGGEVLFPH